MVGYADGRPAYQGVST